MTADPAVLAAPPWSRILALARRRWERTGGDLSGAVTVRDPTDDERRLIIGLTGSHRPPGVASLRLPAATLDGALRREFGLTLEQVLHRAGPLRDRPAERAREATGLAQALADARRLVPRHSGQPWLAQWFAQLAADGTVTRLLRRGELEQLGRACAVLNLLPAAEVSLPVLAERATGNTKALSGTAAATMVLRAWALREEVPPPVGAADRRAVWEWAGVIVDDLSSQVLVLGLRPVDDHSVAGWLRSAADLGVPFRLTLHQLTRFPVTLPDPRLFVCENPAVLRAAASLPPGHAPLVCTEGVPSTACHRLLAGASGTIHWRGDFDWTGLRTTADAMHRYRARPWRMGSTDYLAALDVGSAAADPDGPLTEPLRGRATASPWDPDLAALMVARGRAVMEERLIPLMLGDLAAAVPREMAGK